MTSQQLNERWMHFGVLTLGQLVAWRWLYSKDGCLRRQLLARVQSPERLANIRHNVADVVADASASLDFWSFRTAALLHHSLGVACCIAGSVLGKVWLFQLGLSFEMGEDLLHCSELAYSAALPPGTELFAVHAKEAFAKIGLCLHHVACLFAGSYIFIFVPDWVDMQRIAILLLGAALPGILHFPLMPYVNLSAHPLSPLGRAAAGLAVLGKLLTIFLRLVLYPLMVAQMAGRVFRDLGRGPGMLLSAAAGFFLFFAVLTTAADLKHLSRPTQQQGCDFVVLASGKGRGGEDQAGEVPVYDLRPEGHKRSVERKSTGFINEDEAKRIQGRKKQCCAVS